MRIALIDLDGTLADYDKAIRARMRAIQSPGEPEYTGADRHDDEPPHIEARLRMIRRHPGFWRELERIPRGFEVIDELRRLGFKLHVLTKGPTSTPNAWSEKVEWCREHLADAAITIGGDKSLVYGRVLFDDYPPYFEAWLANRPRGLVICLAHPWNAEFAPGGKKEHANVFRYDGSNRAELVSRLARAYEREAREEL